MSNFKQAVTAFLRDEDGLEMVEYALAGALVVAVGAAVFITLGDNIVAAIGDINGEFDKAAAK